MSEQVFMSVQIEQAIIDYMSFRTSQVWQVSLPDLSNPASVENIFTVKEIDRERDSHTNGATDTVTVYVNYWDTVKYETQNFDERYWEILTRAYAMLTSKRIGDNTCIVRPIIERCKPFTRFEQSGRPVVHWLAVLVYQVANRVETLTE